MLFLFLFYLWILFFLYIKHSELFLLIYTFYSFYNSEADDFMYFIRSIDFTKINDNLTQYLSKLDIDIEILNKKVEDSIEAVKFYDNEYPL